MCEYERAQHPSRPLFKKKMAHAPEERQATTAMEPLEKVGPRSRWPWVALGWAPGAPLWPGASSTVKFFENMVHGQKFARKDVHIIFRKGLKTQKIFLVFFCKKREVLEKNSSMQKTILKISNMQWRKTNKVQRKC